MVHKRKVLHQGGRLAPGGNPPERPELPLDRAKPGVYTVASLGGGAQFLRKLSEMGVHPGARVEVLAPGAGSGPLRVKVKGSQIGVGRGMASRIRVWPEESSAGGRAGSTAPVRLRTLRDYREGERGRVLQVRGEERFQKRIREMGFVKGTEVFVEKYAPLYDPVEYVIKGYHVSLRRNEAENIVMSEPE
jgi:Fur family ferric uptake transcriptional regulator